MNNQTIDGVNRSLLEKLMWVYYPESNTHRCRICERTDFEGHGSECELRALLDADQRPEGCCCPPKGFSGLWAGARCPVHFGLRAIKPAAQPQGEPVATVRGVVNRKSGVFDIVVHDNQALHPGTDLYAEQPASKPELTVWYGAMPESNGKTNWTAMLHRKDDPWGGITLDRSEYPDRVRYEADCVRYMIGELDIEPFILDYDDKLHSGYKGEQ